MRRLHVPLLTPEGVIPYLGAAHHWKEGRSAKLLTDQWWAAKGIPVSVANLLNQASEWRNSELIDAFVERCTDLADGRKTASQSDLLAVVGLQDHLGIIGIEAKVDEGFDKTVDDWRAQTSVGKELRLAKLCSLFGLDPQAVGGLRYQLFHRTASAIIEAKRYRARQAVMVVQSWSPANHGFDDYVRFFETIGLGTLLPNTLSSAIEVDGVTFRTGWSIEAI